MPSYPDRDEIVVVEYDPAWPARFEEARVAIVAALGDPCVAVEHIGSTAVPGLAAKPIIDLLVGLRASADGERCVAPLEMIGFEFRGDGGMPDHLFFRKGWPRTHHLHMVEHGGDFWVEHLAFRDLLRARPDVAREYGRLKRRLAERYRRERAEYTEAKTPFIQDALARAAGGP